MTAGTGSGGAVDDRQAKRAVRLVLVASYVVFADVSIVSLAAPSIQRELNASVTHIELMVAAYQIAYAATLITGGRLGDIVGRRTMFTAAFGGFVVTSTLCGLAQSPGQLIAFRALQGFAAALLSPQVLATIQVVLPPERRVKAFAAQGAVLSLAAMTGPSIAGLLVAADIGGWTWRPIFLINVPIGLVAIPLGLRLIPALRNPAAKRLDLVGVALVVLTLVSLMVPLTLGALDGWPAWAWLLLATTPGLAWVFLWSQRFQERRGRSPLLPTDLWRDKAFRLGVLLYILVFSGLTAFYLFYFILIQIGYGIRPVLAALSVLPSGTATLVFSLLSWRFVHRFGGRRVVAVGAAVAGLGFLAVLGTVTAVPDASVALWTIPAQLVFGAGFGLLLAPLLSVVLAGIRSTAAGAAAGLLTTAQITGGALGVGVTGLLFQSRLSGTIEQASATELAAGMERVLLYHPVVFLLALVVIAILPGRPAPAPVPAAVSAPPGVHRGSGHG